MSGEEPFLEKFKSVPGELENYRNNGNKVLNNILAT